MTKDLFGGIRIIESLYLTVDGPLVSVRRTWRERLLSRPWRPWKRTKLVQTQIPSPDLYRLNGSIVGHPETIRVMKRALEASR